MEESEFKNKIEFAEMRAYEAFKENIWPFVDKEKYYAAHPELLSDRTTYYDPAQCIISTCEGCRGNGYILDFKDK